MYSGYFVNVYTGQLKRTSQPKDNPYGNDWKQVDYDTWCLYVTIKNYVVSMRNESNDHK